MGYYTVYQLHVGNEDDIGLSDEEKEDLGKTFSEMTGYGDVVYEDLIEYCTELKWYDHENDIKKLSEKYPKYKFILEGKGEDEEDMWILYAYGGRIEICRAEIVFPERTLW